MAELREYIVTLHRREDLDDFYDDMETPGGSLYIPDRTVDLALRRKISRNTHYMLMAEEAAEVAKDDRVMGVILKDKIEAFFDKAYGYTEDNTTFARDNVVASATDKNWGQLRHTIGPNALSGEWGSDGTADATGSFTITASGKNVDVLIVDGHVLPDHPEFAVNPDGTGGSRVVQFNWFSLTSQLGLGSNGTYDYNTVGSASDNAHGTHVASTAAGNTLGWARDANIYSLEFRYLNNVNYDGPQNLTNSTKYDYIREWHNTKAINPETGRRNPTVSNHSYGGAGLDRDFMALIGFPGIVAINFRGTLNTKNPGPPQEYFSDAEIEARGLIVPPNGNWSHSGLEAPGGSGTYIAAINADVQDAIDDGIIIVGAAGNNSKRVVNSNDQDYNNLFYYDTLGTSSYYHRIAESWGGTMDNYDNSYNGDQDNSPIVVGSIGINKDDRKASFSVCGSGVDIYAAGYGIVGAGYNATYGDVQDPRNASYYLRKISGTSMASPQVAGVVALFLEGTPSAKQADVKHWLKGVMTTGQMFDSGTDDCTDLTSLQGSFNRILRWVNERELTGQTWPKQNYKRRTLPQSDGRLTYPRRKVRLYG